MEPSQPAQPAKPIQAPPIPMPAQAPARPSWLTVALIVAITLVTLVTLVAITLGVVSLAHAGAVTTLAVGASQTTGIAVCGQGMAFAQPDQAQVTVGVQATSASAESARSQAAQAMNAVLAALKAAGIADSDIQTSYFSIQPVYNYSSGSEQITGYSATNTVLVTIHQVDNVGKIVDATTQAGGNNAIIQGITFSSSDPTQGMAQAEQNALANAHSQAQQVARGAGLTLGAPISIQVGSCGSSSIQPSFLQSAGLASAGANTSTPIQPGQQQVSVVVDVVYAVR